MLVAFHGLRFDLPEGWVDITDDLADRSPPSLARPTGVGALQFSLAKYRSGQKPIITIEELRHIIRDFFIEKNMPCPEIIDFDDEIMSVRATSLKDGELIYVTYLSNGQDIVFVTYLCPDPHSRGLKEDLRGVEQIISSMVF